MLKITDEDHPLFESNLRVRRAKALYDQLEVERNEPFETPVGYPYATDPATGDFIVKLEGFPKFPPEWGVTVGEIGYNLRAALDYSVFRLAGLSSPFDEPDYTCFPISTERDQYTRRGAKSYRNRSLKGVSPIWAAKIDDLQPFAEHGVNELGTLQWLSNRDKHRVRHVCYTWCETPIALVILYRLDLVELRMTPGGQLTTRVEGGPPKRTDELKDIAVRPKPVITPGTFGTAVVFGNKWVTPRQLGEMVEAVDQIIESFMPAFETTGSAKSTSNTDVDDPVQTFQQAFKEAAPFTMEEGFKLSSGQLSPRLAEIVNKSKPNGKFILPPAMPPWRAEFAVTTNEGKSTFLMDLELQNHARDGFDFCFAGSAEGMNVRVLMRMRSRELTGLLDVQFLANGRSARERLPGFRLAAAVSGAGELSLRDKAGIWPTLNIGRHPTVLTESLALSLRLFESIATIEEWTGKCIPPPDSGAIKFDDLFLAADVVDCIRQGFTTTNFVGGTLSVSLNELEDTLASGEIPLEKPFVVNLLGHDVYIGDEKTTVKDAKTVAVRKNVEKGLADIEFTTASGKSEKFRWTLSPPA